MIRQYLKQTSHLKSHNQVAFTLFANHNDDYAISMLDKAKLSYEMGDGFLKIEFEL